MQNRNTVLAAAMVVALAGITGCDVEKKSKGDVTLPKYELNKTQEGNVTVPKYEVTGPDVTVQEKKVEVDVPKVTTEKETVTLPDVNVKTAKEKKAEQAGGG
jgi:hypothetical protein